MRFLYFVIFATIIGTTSHSAASEATAFKAFTVGESGSSLQRNPGVNCKPPLARPLTKDLTGEVRVLGKKMAELDATQDGDLICTVRSQTIGGQPIAKTVLKLYSDRLLQIELSLKFKRVRRQIRSQYYPSAPEIDQIFDTLKGKYGSPSDQRLWYADCSCFVIISNWKAHDGTTITMERREESASEAKVVFTASEYKKVYETRLIARNEAAHEYHKAVRRNAEEKRTNNLRDL